MQILETTWARHEAALKQVRTQVFIVEQNVPTWVEWDEYDASAAHLLALDDATNQPIGCARILDAGKIGRMAVLKAWRGHGVGHALLEKALAVSRQKGFKQVTLSSQTHAVKFYAKAGFIVTSEPYTDVNIWHVDMQLLL